MRNILFKGIGTLILLLALHTQGNAAALDAPGCATALVPGPISPLTDTVCPYGDPGVFTSQPPTGTLGTVTYQWQFQPGCSGPWTDIPGANTLSYDPPAGITTSTCFRLALSDDNGTEFSDSVSVVVRPGPTAAITPNGPTAICLGDSVIFYASGGVSYNWLYNNQPVSLTDDSLIGYYVGDYAVVVTDANGCTDTSLTYAVTLYPPLLVNISSAAPGICPGDSILLSSQVTGNAVSYQWVLDGTPIPGATSASHPATTTGAYGLIVTDANGCQYPSTALDLLPGDPPISEVDQPEDDLICPGQPISLMGHGIGSYQWLLNGQPIPGATDSTYDATATGNYSLVVENGCGTDTSSGIDLVASPGPTAAFDYENYPLDEVLFFNESVNAVEWFWNLGMITSREENIYHGFPGPGSYPVTLIVRDSLGCVDSITVTVNVTDPEFFVPNVFTPNNDGINDLAQTRFDRLNSLDFCIFDRWGNKIFISNSPGVYWDGNINGEPAPEGVYFYQFRALDIRGKLISDSGNLTLLR